MSVTSEQIITALEKDYPQNLEEIQINNCQDINYNFSQKTINQYIFGVTTGDELSPGIRHYEHYMKQHLQEISGDVITWGWYFQQYDIADAKKVLEELDNRYKANLNIEKMFKNLKLSISDSKPLYVVVTIVSYNIVYVE